jgi:hypothetical protein
LQFLIELQGTRRKVFEIVLPNIGKEKGISFTEEAELVKEKEIDLSVTLI